MNKLSFKIDRDSAKNKSIKKALDENQQDSKSLYKYFKAFNISWKSINKYATQYESRNVMEV